MIVMLEVKSGPSAGAQVRLESGHTLTVGRTKKSDFALPADTHLSGLHFAIEATADQCRLRDLNSTNGTWINGQGIKEAVLQNGSTFVAGETTFTVTITNGETAAPVAGPEATPQQRLLELLRNDYQPLYVILDAARDIKILAMLTQTKEEHQSLYEGVQGDKLAHVAPYLVRLQKDSLLLGSLVLEGWGNSWGVYLTCDRDFHEVRRHLRHFLEVQLPDGKQVYFRYYDPRVLRVYLPTCNADETKQFFGPIKCYLTEDEKPETLLRFTNAGEKADKKEFDLTAPASPADKTHADAQPRTLAFPQKAITDPNAR
jgi:Domain of unknown function (DUF4123)/Inner membrane component of T3SS, cytoplasmic domain